MRFIPQQGLWNPPTISTSSHFMLILSTGDQAWLGKSDGMNKPLSDFGSWFVSPCLLSILAVMLAIPFETPQLSSSYGDTEKARKQNWFLSCHCSTVALWRCENRTPWGMINWLLAVHGVVQSALGNQLTEYGGNACNSCITLFTLDWWTQGSAHI